MESYYLSQAGNGLPLQAFSGVRYQKGNGFFGRFFVSKILPILRYLGGQAKETGRAILGDVKSSAISRASDTMQKIAQDTLNAVNSKSFQEGEGKKVIKRTLKHRKKRRLNQALYNFLQ